MSVRWVMPVGYNFMIIAQMLATFGYEIVIHASLPR